MRPPWRAIGVSFLILCCTRVLGAAPQSTTQDFTDRAAFTAATTNAAVIGFNGILSLGRDFETFNPLIVGGVSFSTPIGGVYVNVTKASYYSSNIYSADFIVNSVNPSNNELIISLPKPVHAVALDYGGLGFRGPGIATITLSNGHVFAANLPTVGRTQFAGFVSPDPITTLTLVTTNDDWVLLDLVLASVDFKQNRNADGSLVPWAGDELFNPRECSLKMEGWGCAITSLADVLLSYGLQALPDTASTDPGTLNHYLGENSGTHSGCDIYFDTAARALNYSLLHNDFPCCTSLQTRIQHIDESLNAGNLVIAGIGGHFVVLYEKAAAPAPDGSPDYRILDPYRYQPYATGDRSGQLLSQAYNTVVQDAHVLRVVVVENRRPQPGKSWAIVAHSPVELLVTDPTGAQSGFDPATKIHLQNIVGSAYGVQQGLIDDTGVSPPLPDVLYFGLKNLAEGTYTVQVIATGSGSYTLDFAFASGPGDTMLQTVTGAAVAGTTDTYLVSNSLSPGQPPTIQRTVLIDIKPGEFPNSINPESDGKVPLAIVSTKSFDASTQVDRTSLKFGRTGDEASLAFCNPGGEDVNDDGLLDLVCHFYTRRAAFVAGDTAGILKGGTVSGIPLLGTDSVSIVPRK